MAELEAGAASMAACCWAWRKEGSGRDDGGGVSPAGRVWRRRRCRTAVITTFKTLHTIIVFHLNRCFLVAVKFLIATVSSKLALSAAAGDMRLETVS